MGSSVSRRLSGTSTRQQRPECRSMAPKPNDPAAIDSDDISDENISTRQSRQQLVRHSLLSFQFVGDFLLNAHKFLS